MSLNRSLRGKSQQGEQPQSVRGAPNRLTETLASTLKLQRKTLTPMGVRRSQSSQKDELELDPA
jgi:hypothetical protein